ncbi:MAG: hypothetical protein WC089_00540 [Candidatus Paceibacterota bacterium]
MSKEQYIKLIERELNNINKRIDMKILAGQEYHKEAQDHKLLRRKILQHSRRAYFNRFFPMILKF